MLVLADPAAQAEEPVAGRAGLEVGLEVLAVAAEPEAVAPEAGGKKQSFLHL